MPKKTFTVGGQSGAEPIEFDLVGTDANGSPIQPITFRCKPEIQGVLIKDILGRTDDTLAAGVALIDLIPEAIVPEQVDLYNQVIHSNEIIVKAEVLADIAMYLFEVYNQNPTSAASGSTPGSSSIGRTSMADYLSPQEPTLRPSPPVVSATPPMP